MLQDENKIKICERHEKQVPLLWTFKHDGYEYWCPHCGYMEGMFGAGIDVPLTEELIKEKEMWKEKAKPYLDGSTNEWIYAI